MTFSKLVPNADLTSGIVLRCDAQFHVQTPQGVVPCVLRGKLKKEWQRVTSLVVAGDRVQVRLLEGGTGVIEALEPRRTQLSRPGFHGYEHVIAANVDLVLVVASIHTPPFKRNLVERFLVVARQGGIDALVVVNKIDLSTPREIEALVSPLRAAGAPILLVSAATGQGLPELQAATAGKITALAGQSGVGKSSLLNAICPGLGLRTSGVTASNKGRHTTTSSQLFPLPGGGYVVDTPGVKSLAIWEDDDESVESYYPEIEEAAAGCKFRDCSHTHEPGCAVKRAVHTGKIDSARYENYVRLMRTK